MHDYNSNDDSSLLVDRDNNRVPPDGKRNRRYKESTWKEKMTDRMKCLTSPRLLHMPAVTRSPLGSTEMFSSIRNYFALIIFSFFS